MSSARLRRCFCEIDPECLVRLARQRYVEGRGTLEVLKACQGLEKEAMGCIALLEHSEDMLRGLLDEDPERAEHVVRCWREAHAALRAAGVEVPGGPDLASHEGSSEADSPA